MSEPIPESIPTSSDPRSKRPIKKRALTPLSQQASNLEALFANPDKPIPLPSGAKPQFLAPPPEIVANVQGSSAGAGSGEFHVYKASRRREYERVRLMEEETEKERMDREWEDKQKELKKRDEEKLSKNQKRRMKVKERGGKKKGNTVGRMDVDGKGVVHSGAAPEKSAGGGEDEVNGGAVKTVEVVGIVIHDED
ncbi:DUF1168-domain-containing protein [Tothia fuscella]|uniref:DUF1168-domain-containing protein n=1 Tax=Tothia fuscella TaxID=1048955 RepID=A0A9P4NR58_9PEZI|nr:DUF1168-domain-containing protein [Tothia fuscella]